MAAFNRPTEATYEVHEKVTVDTSGKHTGFEKIFRGEVEAVPSNLRLINAEFFPCECADNEDHSFW